MLYPTSVIKPSEVDEDESSDEQIDECVGVKKKKKKGCSHFSESFKFDADNVEQGMDDLYGVRPFLKQNVSSSLQEKIDSERAKLSFDNTPVLGEEDSQFVQEMENVSDSLREKNVRKRKKAGNVESFFDERASEEALASEVSLSFAQMNLSRPLLKAINACDFNDPTPIQAACIPVALAGRDICACAATGTGKTAAFMLPILERLLYKPKQKTFTRVIILVPTRELAIQVFQVSRQLSQFSQVEICLCAGGLDIKAQEAALRSGPDIVVATPGRLIDHLHNAPNFSLHDVEVLVLDEADRMLEEAFADQMKELIRLCSTKRQTLLFSATMTDQIEDVASMSLRNPVRLFINESTATALNLRQEFIRIRERRENDRENIVAALVTRTFLDHTLIFVRTKKHCQRLHIVLGLLGVKVGQLHSGLSQSQRIETLSRFKKADLDVLVSTDLASRGLDIEGILTVINMHMPLTLKHYIHRVGRTARAGRVGRSVSLVGEDERKVLKEIVVANAGHSLKQRLIEPEVIEAYANRIDALKESIERVEEAERTERALRLASDEVHRGEVKLQEGIKHRQWFQSQQAQSEQKARLKLKYSAKKRELQGKSSHLAERNNLHRLADFQARQAKRARKGKRILAVFEDQVEQSRVKGGAKKNKTKSSFTDHLTSVDKKAVKRFRHGPTDADFKAAKLKNARKNRK